MKKYLLLLLIILNLQLFANDSLKLITKNIANAQTALLVLNKEDIQSPKLTLLNKKKFNINFMKNPFKEQSYYALIPISYYEIIKKHKIIISYIYQDKKVFKSVFLDVNKGDYKSETIKVSSKKVTLNKKSKKRTKKEYKEAMDIYKSTTSEILWNKEFIYPLQSKITSAFGTKRVYNKLLRSYHSGTDFKAKVGEKIHASNAGVVRLASDRFYAGNSVVIDHGQGIYTCYFHLSKIDVKVGQKVIQNEVIGLSGSTGRVTGPHLHFSARVHGIQVDPLQLIKVLNELKKQ